MIWPQFVHILEKVLNKGGSLKERPQAAFGDQRRGCSRRFAWPAKDAKTQNGWPLRPDS